MRNSPVLLLGVVVATSVLVACQEPTGITPETPTPSFSTTYGAELLECPADVTQSAEATIDLLGGTVSVAGSSISIPSGAVLLPTRVTLTVPASNYMEVQITAGGEEHFEFEAPVAVSIDYSRCTRSNIEKTELGAWYIDARTKDLLEPMNASDDKDARVVRFQTDHLSSYAVAH